MFYNVLKLKDLVALDKEELMDKNILLENESSILAAMALKEGQILDWHESDKDACAYVYDGKAEFHFSAEKFEIKEGELLMFKKGDSHKVLALKDTKFLLIRL